MADDVLDQIIGRPTGTTVVAVERGHIAVFADAVLDRSPIYRDPRRRPRRGCPAFRPRRPIPV